MGNVYVTSAATKYSLSLSLFLEDDLEEEKYPIAGPGTWSAQANAIDTFCWQVWQSD